MAGYQYLLLDWDGNLAQTLGLWLDVFRLVLADRGLTPTDEAIAQSFGKTEQFFAQLGVSDPATLYETADRIGKAALPEVELYPEALEVLNEFKARGKQTALITSSNRDNIEPLLEKYDLHALFDVVVAREDTAEQKPHPEPLEKALALLGGTKEQAVMIGDSDKDLGAANNAGIDSILFYPKEHAKFYDLKTLQSYKPTHVVGNFKEILDIV